MRIDMTRSILQNAGELCKVACLFIAFVAFPVYSTQAAEKPDSVGLHSLEDKIEVERVIASSSHLPPTRRVEFISRYLIGRKYRPETRERIKKQRGKKVEKREATNLKPLPVDFLHTSMQFLDCMTYVEHVIAMASCKEVSYESEFLCRLIDVMFDANGAPLQSHLRSHFTSHWGDVNERKGYLKNFARKHPAAKVRELMLNKVGTNRTFYVEDKFMISKTPQKVWYFPVKTVLDKKVKLESGDVLALVTDKEGLDVTHMAFFIKRNGKRWFRHASYKLNRIVDQDFDQYLKDGKQIVGLMVFRPVLQAKKPARYNFNLIPEKK